MRCELRSSKPRETTSWSAGYIEAIFTIKEHLAYLNRRELAAVWKTVGVPPGPWAERLNALNP